jgi:acetate kinase
MGFTAMEGLPMGERCGGLDPGVVLHLIEQKGMSAAEVGALLNKRSGLLGLSGISADLRELEASAAPEAAEALAYFAYRCVREIGSLAAALGGLDLLVFTAGIGEHSAAMRARIGEGCRWLGAEIDPAANARHATRISSEASQVEIYVIPTNEELVIARATRALLGGLPG